MVSSLIIAHRGESLDAPENTLEAINLAWERGAKAVEIDIRLTADNEIVVIHDKDTLRVSGEKMIVGSSSLKELKTLNAGFHKQGIWKDVRIPTLKEVIKTVPENGRLIIEIKSNDTILPKLGFELSQSNLNPKQIELIAFNADILAKAKQQMPEYKMLWLLNLDYFLPNWLWFDNNKRIIKKVKKIKLDGVNVWAGKLLTPDFILAYKKANLLVYTWTVDDEGKIKEFIKNGVDAITTNKAGWILKQLQKSNYKQYGKCYNWNSWTR